MKAICNEINLVYVTLNLTLHSYISQKNIDPSQKKIKDEFLNKRSHKSFYPAHITHNTCRENDNIKS